MAFGVAPALVTVAFASPARANDPCYDGPPPTWPFVCDLSGLTDPGWHRLPATESYVAWTREDGFGSRSVILDGDKPPCPATPGETRCRIVVASQQHGPCPEPCVSRGQFNDAIDSAAIADGPHLVTVFIEGLPGDPSGGASAWTAIDQTPPAAPSAVDVSEGAGWHSAPDLSLRVTKPPEDGRLEAPITTAWFKLCNAVDRARCAAPQSIGIDPDVSVFTIHTTAPGPGDWVADVWLVDAVGNTQQLNDNDDAHVRYDNRAPQVSISPIDPTDPGNLSARATDDLSGIADGDIQLAPHGTNAWRSVPTTVGRGAIAAQVDDTALPRGTYDERVVATDAAGNVGLAVSEASVAVPFRFESRLRAGFAIVRHVRRGHRRVARVRLVAKKLVRLHRHAQIRGSLTTKEGQPLANARVVVGATRAATGAQPEIVDAVTTDNNGRFTYTTVARESRRLTFTYRGTALRQPARADIDQVVPAASSIHVSRRSILNGDTVVVRGRLKGGHLPPGGKLVSLEAWVRGGWQPIANVRTTPSGAWRASHTFATVAGRARFRFRVAIPHDALYPFAPGASRPVSVVVQGA